MSNTNPLVLRLQQSGVLTVEDHDILAALCTKTRIVTAETVLVHQGDTPAGVRLILDGFAYRYRLMPDGRRQILGLLLPGDFCDLQAVVLGKADHFIATLTDCVIADVAQATVDELTYSRTSLARALWWATLVDESIVRANLTNIGQRPADKVLAHFVCELLLRLQVVDRAEADACPFPITQDKLADILGITSIHVNRVLIPKCIDPDPRSGSMRPADDRRRAVARTNCDESGSSQFGIRDLRERDLLTVKGGRAETHNVAQLRALCGFDPDYLHLRVSR